MRKLYVDKNNEVVSGEELQNCVVSTLTELTNVDALTELTNADVLAIAEALELDNDQITELLNRMDSEDDIDFELAGARIIHRDFIDGIQQEELLSDFYCLGCFNASFLADYLPLDTEDIEQLQKAEAYTALGKIASKYIKEIQGGYAAADGYGHHFNYYDGSEIETDHYYVFPRARE